MLLIALVFSFVGVGLEFAATTNGVFFAGKLINGVMVGIVGTNMLTYIGEVLTLLSCQK
jgi:hypothetical protein